MGDARGVKNGRVIDGAEPCSYHEEHHRNGRKDPSEEPCHNVR